jgi:hypothetical protein
MTRREKALQTELSAAEKTEQAESAAHQQQILDLKAKELQKATQLRSSLDAVEAAERLAKQKLDLRQVSDATAGQQQLASLNAKLTRAVTEVCPLEKAFLCLSEGLGSKVLGGGQYVWRRVRGVREGVWLV